MSKKDEIEVSRLIEYNLNIEFQNRKYILDNWGRVDNWCEIAKDTLCESKPGFWEIEKH